MDMPINGRKSVRVKGSQGEKKEKRENERKERKRKRKGKERKEIEEIEREGEEIEKEGDEREREKGRKGSRRFDGRNFLNQGVKFGDSTRGYASRGRDSSYFGLFLTFRLLFWADFGNVLCHVNCMGRICSYFKGLLSERIWVKKLHLRELPKFSCNPRARYCMDWCNSVAPGVLQLWMTISSSTTRRMVIVNIYYLDIRQYMSIILI